MRINKRPIGFATGVLWHTYSRTSKEIIQICREMGCTAIALHDSIPDFEAMAELKREDFAGFDFIEYHAPDMNNQSGFVLDKIQSFHEKLKFDNVVLHPDKVDNWEDLKSYDLPFSVENMDANKLIGKTLEDMIKIMSNNDYKMALDINHGYTNDQTFKLVADLWHEFKDRISHFHLSGFQKLHEPLVVTQQKELIDFVADKNKPIIIESVCKDLDEAYREFRFIKNCLDMS